MAELFDWLDKVPVRVLLAFFTIVAMFFMVLSRRIL